MDKSVLSTNYKSNFIGIPVGFICAIESKEALVKLENTPFITNLGRKGGSSSASAIINAIFKLIRAESSS